MRKESSARCGGHDTSPFVHRSAIEFALGRSAMGQRLASSRRPLRWPLSRPAIHVRSGGGTCRNWSCFAALTSRPHVAVPGSGRPTVSVCEGERRPLRLEVVPQHDVGVGPCGGVAPPRWSGSSRPRRMRRTTTTDHSRGDTEGTTSSFGGVPYRSPHAVPGSLQSRQRNQPAAALSLGRPSGRLTRGERRPLRLKNVDRSLVDVCPRGDVAPLSQQCTVGECTCATAWNRPELEERQPMLRKCDCARSDPRSYGRARPRQGSARSARRGQHARRDLDAASARLTEATIGASRNHEREHHRMPFVLLTNRHRAAGRSGGRPESWSGSRW